MIILVDTNIVLDVFMDREAYAREARMIYSKKIISATENEAFSDFEDCLQEECAVEAMADYIVTRNPDDYRTSRIKVIEPDEFLKLL